MDPMVQLMNCPALKRGERSKYLKMKWGDRWPLWQRLWASHAQNLPRACTPVRKLRDERTALRAIIKEKDREILDLKDAVQFAEERYYQLTYEEGIK